METHDIVQENIIGFKIYYGQSGNAVFEGRTDLKKAWEIAPNYKVGYLVLITSEKDRLGNKIIKVQGKDMYSFDGRKFYASNDSREMEGRIIHGRWLDDQEMLDISQRATYDRRKWSGRG